ncbi:MAG TPA: CdaR family protein [Terriglobales bacterium]|nr:CdaR family protein [Terriglobales bacterium]
MDLLRRYVFSNFWLKLLSLSSALLLWLGVARQPQVEIAHTIPLEFVHMADDISVVTDAPPQAQVWIRGPERVVGGVRADDLHATIDLAGVRREAGERTFELAPGQIRAPHGITVVQVVPGEFHLRFDRRVTRQVPIKARVQATLPPGYEIQSVTADPPTAMIEGPETRVTPVEAATTDTIDASGTAGRAVFSASAYVDDPLVHVVAPTHVRVIVVTGKSSSGAAQ